MQNNKQSGFMSWMRDKGYYIVLVLCVAAVGISGYLYFSQSAAPEGEATAASAMEQEAVLNTQDAHQSVETMQEAVESVIRLQLPLAGPVVETFATDHLAYNDTTKDWRVHPGIDLTAAAGTDVCAAADGVVSGVFEDDLLGQQHLMLLPAAGD